MKFTHKNAPIEGEDADSLLRVQTALTHGSVIFEVPKTFNEGYKGVEAAILNEAGKECGQVKAVYFLKGDFSSWDAYSGDTFQIWEAAEEDYTAQFVSKNLLKVSRPLNKCLFIQLVSVQEKDKGKKLGVESILAIFDYFHKKHGAKSMAAELMPLQHVEHTLENVKADRPKGRLEDDMESLAIYLAQELNITFFAEKFWIHGPNSNQRIDLPWKERGPARSKDRKEIAWQ
jgi:hypothetical protein